jgi:uncharacterized protein
MKSFVCITGATGGLGKAITLECASRGWDLYLTDLHPEPLKKLASGLMRFHGVEVLYDPCNLTDPEARKVFWKHVQDLGFHFHMLINIAGLDFEGGFMERSAEELSIIIRLNIESTVSMTRRILDYRNPARKFHIIYVSSLAGFYPMPLKAVYAASKRFLLDFSRAMRQELRGENVYVMALCPAGLATKPETINSIQSQGWMGVATTIQTGKVAARTINRALWGYSVYIPGWINQVLKVLGALAPADWVAWMICRRWMKTRKLAAEMSIQGYNQIEKSRMPVGELERSLN